MFWANWITISQTGVYAPVDEISKKIQVKRFDPLIYIQIEFLKFFWWPTTPRVVGFTDSHIGSIDDSNSTYAYAFDVLVWCLLILRPLGGEKDNKKTKEWKKVEHFSTVKWSIRQSFYKIVIGSNYFKSVYSLFYTLLISQPCPKLHFLWYSLRPT